MAKAKMELPNGTVITIDGTVGEIEQLIRQFGGETSKPTPPKLKSPAKKKETRRPKAPLSLPEKTVVEIRKYFDKKDPKTKGEELAVAARYRETKLKQPVHKKEDFQQMIEAAGRPFDSKNFAQDIRNARRQAGLFDSGGKGKSKLSYYGKKYINALPNREAASKIRRPTDMRRRSDRKKR